MCVIYKEHKKEHTIQTKERYNAWLLICDVVAFVLVIVCKLQRTHKGAYRINMGSVEYLVVDMGYCSFSTSDCV